MLTFLLCLLPILASVFGPTSARYILDIDYNTLKTVQFIDDPDPVLNLSSRNLHVIEKDAFDNVTHVISLDLSNNSLTSLPEFIFSNLTKLESLSLANNRLLKLQHLFLGLKNLTMLDISRNPIHHLQMGSLFGLPKFTRILIDGNNFKSFSTDMSRNYSIAHEELKWIRAQPKSVSKNEMKIVDDTQSQNAENDTDLHKNIRLKLCKSDGIVTTLYFLWRIEELDKGCVPIDVSNTQIYFGVQNITGFREDWYRLHILPIDSLDLSNNWIAEIKKEMLNNLPASLTSINFQSNQIRKIRSQVIENDHLRALHFTKNLVDEIEDNAFAKTRLYDLDLSGNQMNSLDFISTLPYTMTKLIVGENRIISIPNDTFPILPNLSYLDLRKNKIETLENHIFKNLISLQVLILERNNITTIRPATFRGLTTLKTLNLQGNYIRDLRANTFTELTALKTLDLSWNKIVKISFTDLPLTLNSLFLDSNEIGVLEKGSFVETPRITLSLVGNHISSIARDAFNLPILRNMHLDRNNLTTIDGDSYKGLDSLKSLLLSENQISEIRNGSCKHLRGLYKLDLSSNPFQKLEAGAFHGLNIKEGISVFISDNNLKEMKADIFGAIADV